ncbi:RNA polymerase sigma factor SigA2 [compost metagenome]
MKRLPTTRLRSYHPQLGTQEECYRKHYKLIHDIVNQFKHLEFYGIDRDDLFSEGTLGLLNAYDRYDAELQKAKFSTYAYKYIKGFILRYLEGKAQLIHIPFHSNEKPKKIIRIDRKVRSKDGTETSLSEIIAKEEEDHTELEINQFIATLPNNEKVTLELLLAGYTSRMVSERIGVSTNTIGEYKKRIAKKYTEMRA